MTRRVPYRAIALLCLAVSFALLVTAARLFLEADSTPPPTVVGHTDAVALAEDSLP